MLYFWISPRIFRNIQNGPHGILRGLGETDSWKKPEVKISCQKYESMKTLQHEAYFYDADDVQYRLDCFVVAPSNFIVCALTPAVKNAENLVRGNFLVILLLYIESSYRPSSWSPCRAKFWPRALVDSPMTAQILVIKAPRPPLHILCTGSNNYFPGLCCFVAIKGWDIPYLDTKHSLSYKQYLRVTSRTVTNIITSSNSRQPIWSLPHSQLEHRTSLI